MVSLHVCMCMSCVYVCVCCLFVCKSSDEITQHAPVCLFLSLWRRYVRIRSYAIGKFDDPVPEPPEDPPKHENFALQPMHLHEEIPVALPNDAHPHTYVCNPVADAGANGVEKEEKKEEEEEKEEADSCYDKP